MRVCYSASIGVPKRDRQNYGKQDNHCFDNVDRFDAYCKEIYFSPTTNSKDIWLWVLGHEKSTKEKSSINRMWTTRWAFHICVAGKGFYNDIPIKRGTCFLSWPYAKHNLVADENDPFEFYYLIMAGTNVADFACNCGFSESQLVFDVNYVDDMVRLFEFAMNTNYANFDVYEYTMGLAKMILSCSKPEIGLTKSQEILKMGKPIQQYTEAAKQLLKNSNYTLSIDALSKMIGVSAKHLSKVFYEDTNETLKQYIVNKKIDWAAKMLRSGVTPTEVAYSLEYSNYSAFHRMFVSRFGVSPTQYVKTNK